jgi:putative copper export protein
LSVDAIAIAVRALGFMAMLLAVGIPIYIACFGSVTGRLVDELRSTARWLAVASLLLVGLHQALEAARMTGALSGLLDISWQRRALMSSTGIANAMRITGLLAVVAAGTGSVRSSRVPGLLGGVLVAASFAVTGHTSIHPLRGLLAPLLVLHLWVAAFWFGALWPLYRLTKLEPHAAAAVIARFSRVAAWLVPGLAVAGLMMAVAILPDWQAMRSPYGLLLAGKVLGFTILMGLAALNRFRLGPALALGSLAAARSLRLSLIGELVVIAAVLAITASMTAMFSPMAE